MDTPKMRRREGLGILARGEALLERANRTPVLVGDVRPVCERCGGPSTLYRHELSRGTAVKAWCDRCDASALRNKTWIPTCLLRQAGVDIASLPEINASPSGPCEHCGDGAVLELHHWAPRKAFDDADDWPTSMLCGGCHRLWHSVMTGDDI